MSHSLLADVPWPTCVHAVAFDSRDRTRAAAWCRPRRKLLSAASGENWLHHQRVRPLNNCPVEVIISRLARMLRHRRQSAARWLVALARATELNESALNSAPRARHNPLSLFFIHHNSATPLPFPAATSSNQASSKKRCPHVRHQLEKLSSSLLATRGTTDGNTRTRRSRISQSILSSTCLRICAASASTIFSSSRRSRYAASSNAATSFTPAHGRRCGIHILGCPSGQSNRATCS